VREEVKKLYVAYKTDTNFVDIIPRRKYFRLSLNMKFHEIHDPNGMCRDITGKGKWGNGDVDVTVIPTSNLDEIMALIRQSFAKHFDGDETSLN
jgi:predicted transport protein